MKYNIATIIFLVTISFYSCTNYSETDQKNKEIEQELNNTITFAPEEFKSEDIVFYNLFSPVELEQLIKKKQSYYKSTIINPLHNITNYYESTDAALNLGVYGADLSYLWMFNQSQQALSYLTAIQRLADQLSIPREYVDFTLQLSEAQGQEYDSLVAVARTTYKDVDAYLKSNEQGELAAMVLLGGYIESLNIALNLNHELNENMISRVATQKFSINSLYTLLMNYQDNLNISEYLILLRKLKNAFDNFDIQFPEGSLVVDTVKHRINWSEQNQIQLSAEEILEIRMITNQLRRHITENI